MLFFQTVQDTTKLVELQTKLDTLFTKKAQGAYVRSRAKWMEQDETNTFYFFGLEKKRQESNSINTLIINNSECSDAKIISEEVYCFYSKLYSSS